MLYYFIICLASNLMHKNDKKRLEIVKAILFHIHKHCTTSFTSLQPIFTVIWLPVKVANSKREKRLQNDIKGVDLFHRIFKGPPNALMGSYTPFYRSIPHFTSLQPIFTVFCSKTGKFEAGKTAVKWYKMARSLLQGV